MNVSYMLQRSEPTKPINVWASRGLIATFAAIRAPLFGSLKQVAAN